MGAEIPGVVKFRCSVKNYDWDRPGKESAVARLYAKNCGEKVDGGNSYTEFWMGTHESGQYSGVEGKDGCDRNKGDDVSLKDWIERYPIVLGDVVLQRWGPSLPFLFKVLRTVICCVPEIAEVVGSSCADQVLISSEDDG